jgi:hypothetical protein
MVRRTIAAGGVLVVVILLVLLFRGCLDARKERSIKDYSAQSAELVDQSKLQGETLFELLSEPGDQGQAIDRTNALNGLRVESASLVDRANDLDVPGEVSTAQRYFVDALELRRDALARVADELPGALADQERRQSTESIANVMQVFLASDVLLIARYKPSLEATLKDEELDDEVAVPRDEALRFVPSPDWVDPAFVADQIEGIRSGTGADGAAAPGLHGNGLGTVSLGGVALTAGAGATVQLADDLAFDIQVTNQGENNETDVNVKVTVGRGDEADTLEESIDTIAVGETKTVTIPLGQQPPTGQNVPINVLVEPVSGEEKTDNNEADFTVIFTR